MLEIATRPTSAAPVGATSRAFTPRVVLLCLALAALFGWIVPVIDLKFSNTYLGAMHLPPGALAVLLGLLLGINPLLHWLSKTRPTRFWTPFSRNETLVVYISCLFSCLVPGFRSESSFVGALVSPFYFASRENKWLEFLAPNLKAWFTPALNGGGYSGANQSVVGDWMFGASGGAIPWGAWLVPLLAWGILIAVLYGMQACLSVILRLQWSQREALAFPLLKIPLALTEDVDDATKHGVFGRVLSNPLFWVGALVAISIQMLRGLHLYFPDVPDFPREIPTWPLQAGNPPWDQIGWTPIFFYPLAIAVTYLLTSEVGFSLWAFAWFIKFQYIAAYYVGIPQATLPTVPTMGMPAFTEYQRIGAFLTYVALIAWTGREQFAHIARRALGRETARKAENDEAFSYPVAFWGFWFCLSILIVWSIAAGIRWDIALLMWGGYLVTMIALTRVVIEGGFLFLAHGLRSLGFIGQLFGSGSGAYLNPQSIVPGTFLHYAVMYEPRGMLLPSFVQSFKLAHDQGIKPKPLMALIGAVVAISLFMAIWMRVKLGYEHGGFNLNGSETNGGPQDIARNASEMINGSFYRHWSNWFWIAVGIAITYGLMFMRSRFLWFSLHPLGYLTTLTWSIDQLWSSIFVGWACKVVITKYSGNSGYRAAMPLFLGLGLGDVMSIVFWLVIDGWQGRVGHQLLPG